MTRRPAFDPGRLADGELDRLLPPPEPTAPAGTVTATRAISSTPATAQTVAGEQPEQPSVTPAPSRARRGSGGRPRQPTTPATVIADADTNDGGTDGPAIVVAAVRIPKLLYDAVIDNLLTGAAARPSYAQIVAWTCEDHPDDVLAEIRHAATATGRAPRGRKLATETVPLALRFRRDERRTLDELTRRGGVATTRTAAVIGALRVAVKHGLSTPQTTADSRTRP